MERFMLTADNHAEACRRAAEVLASGGLVMYPTETMYGVGADATNPEAVSRLLAYKNRPAGKAVSVLVADAEAAALVVEPNSEAQRLYATFLPGPLTVVSKSRGVVDPRLESESGTLGIRMSSHPFASALAFLYGRPISATSANASGKARPYAPAQALAGLSDRQKELLSMIVDAGELPRREPSTVIDTTSEVQEVVRAGELFADSAPVAVTASEEETRSYAARLMGSLLYRLSDQPVVIALEGPMGAGKTRFAQGLAEAVGVSELVNSPTYSIMKEYESVRNKNHRFIHMDCWRSEGMRPEEFRLDRELKPGTVLAVEWPEPMLPFLRSASEGNGVHILLVPLDENRREIRIRSL